MATSPTCDPMQNENGRQVCARAPRAGAGHGAGSRCTGVVNHDNNHESGGPLTEHVLGDTVLQSQTLEDVSSAVRYHAWLTSLAEPYLGDDPVEIGSGRGDYAERWATGGRRVTATDADGRHLAALYARFANNDAVTVRELAAPSEETADHSAVAAFNVLEHIPDEVAALRGFGRLLRPGGAVVLFVPAFPFAMSRFDRAVGHQRRYRLDSLLAALAAAGLRTERLHYVNAPGLLAWFAGMRVLGMTPSDGPALRLWDRGVIPIVRKVESRRPPPFGQSLFAVARR